MAVAGTTLAVAETTLTVAGTGSEPLQSGLGAAGTMFVLPEEPRGVSVTVFGDTGNGGWIRRNVPRFSR